MRPLIAGNWKMNGWTEQSAALAEAVRAGASNVSCDLLVCPPFTQIGAVARILAGSPVAVGGQDCHYESEGAHTGISPPAMLRDLGARW